MKTYHRSTTRIWFDPSLRLWTLQRINKFFEQVGSVEYTTSKKVAFFWLRNEGRYPIDGSVA